MASSATDEPGGRLTLDVPAEAAGERLDRFLSRRLALPRNQIQGWIAAGRVEGPATPRPSTRLAGGERIVCTPPPAAAAEIVAEDLPLRVLWEDEHLVAVDKPAGLVTHPGAGRDAGTLAHRLLHRYPEMAAVGGPGRPGIVHRLDKGTSGVLLAARTPEVYLALTRLFARRAVDKRYLAVAHGRLEGSRRIEAAIGRHPQRRKEMAVVARGRPAISVLHPRQAAAAATLIEVELLTGRTHQIRVHLKHAGHPLVGDPVYGEARWKAASDRTAALLRDFPRPALHAWRLALAHPVSGAPLSLLAPAPDDLRQLWAGLGGDETALAGEAGATTAG